MAVKSKDVIGKRSEESHVNDTKVFYANDLDVLHLEDIGHLALFLSFAKVKNLIFLNYLIHSSYCFGAVPIKREINSSVGNCSKINLNITSKGTHRNIPVTPQM